MLSEFASMSEITRFMFFWTLPALLIETWLLGRWLAWRPLTAFRNVLLAHLVSFGVNFWLYSTGFFSAVAAATVWGRTMSFDVSSENGILIFLYDAISYPLMVMFSTMIEPLLLLLLPPPRIPKSRVCVCYAQQNYHFCDRACCGYFLEFDDTLKQFRPSQFFGEVVVGA